LQPNEITEFAGTRSRLGGLRVRLTVSYVLFFALVLIVVGLLFRRSLQFNLHQQSVAVLNEEWGAIRGYLRFNADGTHHWSYHADDPEEAYVVERLRRVFLLTDLEGNVLEMSNGYRLLDGPRMSEIREADSVRDAILRTKRHGDRSFLIRQGTFRDQGRTYFLALGLSMLDSERALASFTGTYFLMVPVLLIGVAGLGWLAAGRALRPLNELVTATQRISGPNLTVRLALTGHGDELDTLISRFNEMLERLERSFVQMRQFTINASHELRTPITAIRGQLEVALFTARSPEEYQEAISTALHDVERMGQIVKSLLLLSQVESGQVALEKGTVDLAPIVEAVANHFHLAAEEKGITLTHVVTPNTLARVDRAQCERMVSNLVSNAVKFTPSGGEVRVTLTRDTGHVYLTVSDTGQGIPAEHLPHIFDRFYRVVHSEREPERGLGLGLSFVDWIVKAHDGTIEVKSEEGRGATFLVTLPSGSPTVPFAVFQPAAPACESDAPQVAPPDLS